MSKIDGYNDNSYVQPDFWRYMAQKEKGMGGDIVAAATPATPGSSAAAVAAAIGGAAAKFTRTVTIKLQDAAGNVHDWFNGQLGITIAEVTAGDGVAAIAAGATKATFVEGVATVVVEYTGTWALGDTSTLTLTQATVLGYTVAAKTSVDTLVA